MHEERIIDQEGTLMAAIIFDDFDITLAEADSAVRHKVIIPPHIEQTPWLDYQQATVQALCESLSAELKDLHDKPAAKRVHDTRVALRRWFSVWAVLQDDGWESKKFRGKVVRKLRKLLKLLGRLRDWDVNLELAEALGCPPALLAEWAAARKLVRRAVKSGVKHLDTDLIVSRMKKYLTVRAEKLKEKLHTYPEEPLSSYQRLDQSVSEQEQQVRELEATASTIEELHQLRLGIKRWRYLMTEFFGLTNLELVRAQQLLGKLNDYQRLDLLLAERDAAETKAKLQSEKARLLEEFGRIRRYLPYGLRPLIVSIVAEGRSEAAEPSLLK